MARYGVEFAIEVGEKIQADRAKSLSVESLEREVLEMRLFALAKGLSPIGAEQEPARLPEKLKINRQLVIPHNPWQTYLNLRKAIALEQWKRSAGDLPRVRVRGFDLPEGSEQNSTIDERHNARQVFDLFNEVQATVRDISEQDRAELSALNAALTKMSTQMQTAEASTGRRVSSLQARLNIVLWVSGAVLLLLLFRWR